MSCPCAPVIRSAWSTATSWSDSMAIASILGLAALRHRRLGLRRAGLPARHDRRQSIRPRPAPRRGPSAGADARLSAELTAAAHGRIKPSHEQPRRSRRHRPRSAALPVGDAGGGRRAGLSRNAAQGRGLHRAPHDVLRAGHGRRREPLRPHRHGSAAPDVRRPHRRGAAGRSEDLVACAVLRATSPTACCTAAARST